MSLRVTVIVLLFAVLEGVFSDPDEKIKPVELYHRCFHLQNDHLSKSPILLLHGMGTTLENWNNVTGVLALGTGRRVCAVDLRNYGDSPHDDRYDILANTKDIDHFLDKEGIKKVNIIGHSLGGKIAINYALDYPKRVDSLVVEDIAPNTVIERNMSEAAIASYRRLQDAVNSVPDGANEEEAYQAIINFLRKKMAELGVKEEVQEWEVKSLPIRLVEGKWQWKMNIDTVIKSLENYDEFWTKSSGVYQGPALFIYGTESPFNVGGEEEHIKELFPNVKMIPVQGAGHLIHAEHGRIFTDEVIKMINEIQ